MNSTTYIHINQGQKGYIFICWTSQKTWQRFFMKSSKELIYGAWANFLLFCFAYCTEKKLNKTEQKTIMAYVFFFLYILIQSQMGIRILQKGSLKEHNNRTSKIISAPNISLSPLSLNLPASPQSLSLNYTRQFKI